MTTPAPVASPFAFGHLAQLTLSLALIVGLIYALAWVLRRVRTGGAPSRGDIVILDQLHIGPRERIVLVGIGHAQVLVGVGAAGMVALTPLADPLVSGRTDLPAQAFATKLRDLMQRQGGKP